MQDVTVTMPSFALPERLRSYKVCQQPAEATPGTVRTPPLVWFEDRFTETSCGKVRSIDEVVAGTVSAPAPEPSISVAFDPDLRQFRGSVYIRRVDHPLLDASHSRKIQAAGTALLEPGDDQPRHRARALLVHAFSHGDRAAGLLAVHRLPGRDIRAAGVGFAAVYVKGGAVVREVRDRPAPAPWTQSL